MESRSPGCVLEEGGAFPQSFRGHQRILAQGLFMPLFLCGEIEDSYWFSSTFSMNSRVGPWSLSRCYFHSISV